MTLFKGSATAGAGAGREQRAALDVREYVVLRRVQMSVLAAVALLFLAVWGLYAVNLLRWSGEPYFGWSIGNERGRMTIFDARGPAGEAGLAARDRVVMVNGVTVETYPDLQRALVRQIGGENVYVVARQGRELTVRVPNVRLGLGRTFLLFGSTWLLGAVFLLMGAVVFFMKPGAAASRAFLSAAFHAALYITFIFTGRLSPPWLESVGIYAAAFLPASLVHLAMVFPLERFGARLRSLPYAVSGLLFLALRASSPLLADIPPAYSVLLTVVMALCSGAFLASLLLAYLKSGSGLARARSQVVFLGSSLALVVPVTDTVVSTFAGITLAPHPIFYLPLYTFFPLSIGYAIVRHNLFDVDVYIKRAVGYGLMTAFAAALYTGVQVLFGPETLRPLLGDQAGRVYPVLFALLVVFFFNPVNHRVQATVDRVFFRKKFDYKATVIAVGNALSSVLRRDEVVDRILRTALVDMFIDRACLIAVDRGRKTCGAFRLDDAAGACLPESAVSPEDPLVALLGTEKALLSVYDVEEDPRFVATREPCLRRFEELGATLALPLLFRGNLVGALTLGRKKSGHNYTGEDIDLLGTLAGQGAVALENSRLLEENLVKTRMEEELKIAHDIQNSMLPSRAPEVPGFAIAARSIPAREVGGDFYDFIETGNETSGRRLALVVGDVSGKGVSAALVMAAARSIFRVLTETLPSVEQVMNTANLRLHRDVKKGMFVALLYAALDPARRTLTFSNGGQTQPVLARSGGRDPEFLVGEGDSFPLGIVPGCRYQEAGVCLGPGDTVVLYTDGIVEAVNARGEMYGFDRLLAVVGELVALPPEAVLDRLLAEVTSHAEGVEQHDDLTVVVVRAL